MFHIYGGQGLSDIYTDTTYHECIFVYVLHFYFTGEVRDIAVIQMYMFFPLLLHF